MGIIRLNQFLKSKFNTVLKRPVPSQLKKRSFAVDASSTIYSFLAKTITFSRNSVNIPTDSDGNQTGHLIGLLYRILLYKEFKINSIWVFDGKPPQHKFDQIYRRRQLKEQAFSKAQQARDEGDIQEAVRQSKRTIFISKQEREDAMTLLKLTGLPVVQAISEGQAQCAWLAKNNYAQGVIGEDMDTLAFGSPLLIRGFSRDNLPTQIQLKDVLQSLGLTYEQFIDFCILCGCDYTAKIPMFGPVKALSYIKTYQNIENVVNHLREDDKLRKKHPIPDDFNYLIARRLFTNPQVNEKIQFNTEPFDEEKLKSFLFEKNFEENRINKWVQKVKEFDRRQID